MSVSFKTVDPCNLLHVIKKTIDSRKADLWMYDKHGDFRLRATALREEGMLRPSVSATEGLTLKFIPKTVSSKEPYPHEASALYRAQFMESMMEHCNAHFSYAVMEGHDQHSGSRRFQ